MSVVESNDENHAEHSEVPALDEHGNMDSRNNDNNYDQDIAEPNDGDTDSARNIPDDDDGGGESSAFVSLPNRYSEEVQHDTQRNEHSPNSSNEKYGGNSDEETPSATVDTDNENANSANMSKRGLAFQSPHDEFYGVDQSVNLMDVQTHEANASERREEKNQNESLFTYGGRWNTLIMMLLIMASLSLFLCAIFLFPFRSSTSTSTTLGSVSSSQELHQQAQRAPPMTNPEQRQEAFTNILLDQGITTQDDLNDPTSPAHQAMDWLVNIDPAHLYQTTDNSSGEEQRILAQRFASATLYFAFHQKEIMPKSKGMTTATMTKAAHPQSLRRHLQHEFIPSTSKKEYKESYSAAVVNDKLLNNSKDRRAGEQSHDNDNIDLLLVAPNFRWWAREHRWMTSDSHCNWYGIQCEDVSGTGIMEMVQLNLTSNRLVGELPYEIFQLPTLKVVDLSYNYITNELPVNKITKTFMESIDLSHNRLFGFIRK